MHSRKRSHALHHLREWFWPSMGWTGLARWMEIKMKRTKGSAHKIALGFACGAFISFTPFMGFHILLGGALAWILGGSIWVNALGTIVGNPWTFPFIWAWSYKLGNFILGIHNPAEVDIMGTLGHVDSVGALWETIRLSWDGILFPMLVGGTPTGILVGLGFYWAIRFNIESWRKARFIHLQHQRKKRHKKETKPGKIMSKMRRHRRKKGKLGK